MYSFSIKRDLVSIVEITLEDSMIRENIYLQNLIEKCFEKVFQIIIRDNKEVDFSEEIDLEDDD